MHFVKKVPTTAEQKAVIEKQRYAKLKMFCNLRDQIFVQRSQNELNEDLLRLCEAVLVKNPDIYTLWNIRREVLDKLKEQSLTGDESINLERLYADELSLTEQCIKTNPKSYSAWFQRSWILNGQATPDLKKELAMCKEGLKMDCRNFHCWDHRRIVARMAQLTDEEELSFSEKLIADNFSNFSAWHMRMSLIPRFEDMETGERLMSQETVKEEIKRVANAMFTDPEDQSAWMYARYIIHLYSPASFLNKESSCPIVPLSASIDLNRLIVVFTRSITVENALFFFRGIPAKAEWRAVSRFSTLTSRVWECILEEGDKVEMSKDGIHFESLKIFCRKDLYERILCGGPVSVIDSIREHCEELLQEEKNNSMGVVTVTQCLRLTSPLHSHSIIMNNLERLATSLDPLRANMYRSMGSQESIRYRLLSKEENGERTILDGILEGEGRLSLKYLQLTELSNIDLFAPLITELDVGGNRLGDGSEIALLPRLTHLSIDENPIHSLPSSLSSLSRLDFISCAMTSLSDVSAVGHTLQQCPSLTRFLYCQTPLVDKTDVLRNSIRDSIRLIPHYL
ncbi:hypothetical protein PENTCL1PPCAC_17919 [Pristionchus entomophagus]|uniref:Geranylgeranyl transferase type-2 subunit alpha n=1 Tax=Pristionchus entomophagus TaxID=358040 RepID=A0AAV5TMX7_9BILA|nr:hypothetical protein PENTCL1PPCAC_17919 [Pristionchus entomophagus]